MVALVLADALPVGPILIGPAKPAHILTTSVTARGIVNMTAVAVVEATAVGPAFVAEAGGLLASASALVNAAAGLTPAGELGGGVRMFEAMAWFCVLSMICTRAPTFTASKSVTTSRERIRIHP